MNVTGIYVICFSNDFQVEQFDTLRGFFLYLSDLFSSRKYGAIHSSVDNVSNYLYISCQLDIKGNWGICRSPLEASRNWKSTCGITSFVS